MLLVLLLPCVKSVEGEETVHFSTLVLTLVHSKHVMHSGFVFSGAALVLTKHLLNHERSVY